MFIAIVGTRSAGKSTVENYLVSSLGFSSVRLARTDLVEVSLHCLLMPENFFDSALTYIAKRYRYHPCVS